MSTSYAAVSNSVRRSAAVVRAIGRKLRGNGEFSAYEVAYLAEHYGINAGLGPSQFSFSLPLDASMEPSGQAYLDSLREVGRQIEASAAQRSDIKMRSVGGRVMTPWLLSEPTLALFKLYEYDYAGQDTPARFDAAALLERHDPYLKEARLRYEYYAAIASEEILGQLPFENFMATVKRFADRRLIDAEGLQAVHEALKRLLDRIATALRSGSKELGGTLRLSDNPHYAIASVITIRTPHTGHALFRLADPLYGVSSQAYTVDECDRVIDLAKAKSTLLGGDGSGAYRKWIAVQSRSIERAMDAATRSLDN